MPVVTALRRTRSAARLAVHIDDRYAFSASESFIARHGLYEGRLYDDGDLAQLLDAAHAEALATDAYRLLAHRARSRAELRDRLLRKGYQSAEVEAALQRLETEGLVDDRSFARAFAADKVRLAGWGRRRIARELGGHGLSPADIDDVLATLSDEAEAERALAALRRQGPPHPPLDRARKRAYEYLVRRGFETEVAYAAITRWASQAESAD